ncbi:queuosine tRNA-ribosyltransferase [Alteromonas phage vB_AcoS-R7M]|uniref:Queuosine tRNA-ribosyltransferase n=1 Tax=Alteromonas phage vB_AcoS-R7M TaxID=2729541 RepID=A0A6M3YNE9_9CAUD|nr:queuine tRNA-ribosyltransferase [Alteromonas phage vB_AcoS-R7M]QJI53367.1 queuosine tRNA-ribosyltransferase [Alteromonas phage vB_AcoS-R7M]
MYVYMAAVHSNGYKHTNRYLKLNDREKLVVNTLPHLLESYHYIHKQSFVDAIRESGDKIFLDSGAFSAYTLGVNIDLPTYCEYIKRNDDIIRRDDGILMASVLDGIGDPQETYENQLAMESHGVRPLPCFHAGEDERYLEWYVSNYEYITLGGMVGGSTKQLMVWLDRIWDRYLTDGSGNPRIKVHGFGITSIPLMERYPWWSCDSSSWIQSAAFGSVIMPEYGPINVSDKSPSRHDPEQHVCNLNPEYKKHVLKLFNDNGYNYERLSTVYESRAVYNLWAFGKINEQMDRDNPNKFKADIQELF